jgi:hypothetical protein
MAISPELMLLDVMQGVSDVAANEDETLAAIVHFSVAVRCGSQPRP